MAVDLMGSWDVNSAGDNFSDDDPAGTTKKTKDYVEVTTDDVVEEEKLVNLSDTFAKDEDPDTYINAYDRLKEDIRKIEINSRKIKKLCERYNSSTGKQQNQDIMKELDDIMSSNARITAQIKANLKAEKANNDKYCNMAGNKGSSIGQWRVNQLNSSTKRFKTAALQFSESLNIFNATLRDKQKRHIDILDDRLTEQEKEEMVDDYERAEAFIQEQFKVTRTSDAVIHRLNELEQRHEGMVKIEKSVKELQEMWTELNVIVTEQQEMFDHITNNVEQTRDYVKSARKHLTGAEENQKRSRKIQLCALGCCIVILVIVLIAMGAGGVFSGS